MTIGEPMAVIHLVAAPGLAPDATIFQNNKTITWNSSAPHIGLKRVGVQWDQVRHSIHTQPAFARAQERAASEMNGWNPSTGFVGLPHLQHLRAKGLRRVPNDATLRRCTLSRWVDARVFSSIKMLIGAGEWIAQPGSRSARHGCGIEFVLDTGFLKYLRHPVLPGRLLVQVIRQSLHLPATSGELLSPVVVRGLTRRTSVAERQQRAFLRGRSLHRHCFLAGIAARSLGIEVYNV